MARPSVLIVDESAENREVLRTALERRGNRIFETHRADTGLALAKAHRPDLIVLDMEVQAADCLAENLHLRGAETPIVAIATARRQVAALPHGEFVAKPYHFAPLIRKIEEMLAHRAADRQLEVEPAA